MCYWKKWYRFNSIFFSVWVFKFFIFFSTGTYYFLLEHCNFNRKDIIISIYIKINNIIILYNIIIHESLSFQYFTPYTEKKCYWIKSIYFQQHVYHGFKSICYRISYIFIGSCSIFLWINSIHAFGKKCFWFNSIFFSVYYFSLAKILSNPLTSLSKWTYFHVTEVK